MNMLMILQAAQPAGGGNGSFLIMQRKQQKELEKFRNELKKGDKVVTAGGIYGTVDEIKERYVLLKVDGETRLRVDKNSLVRDYSDAQQQQ